MFKNYKIQMTKEDYKLQMITIQHGLSMTCETLTPVVKRAERIAYKHILPIFFSLGFIGSIFNLVTLFSNSKFTSRLYTYLKALSLYDICFLIFAYSIEANRTITSLNSNKIFISYKYFLGTIIVNGFKSASVYVVVCMTIER